MASCSDEISPGTSGAGEKSLCAVMPSPTKTSLGPKDGAGYPVLWSEGDQLRVNGEASSAAKLIDGGTKANFTIPSSVSLPYNIVYPYSDEATVSSGVIFPSEQEYEEGTFSAGSAPMYAYSSSFDDVTMHYLAAVLRLDVKSPAGKTVVLSDVLLSCGSQIAGEFAVDCTSGAIRPVSKPVYNITYKLPSGGLAVGDTPSSFFITIPSGNFGTIDADILSSDGSVMSLKLSADGILPGIVREYPAVEFQADAEYFVIGDDVKMREFAQMVAAGTFSKEKAVLVSDIDLKGEEWSCVEGFNGVFDGMGHVISGLSSPLFGFLAGTVCNAFIDAEISDNTSSAIGAVARKLTGGTVSRVTVDGRLEYAPASVPSETGIGAIAGEVSSGNIEYCVNRAGISAILADDATSAKMRMGGIAGKVVGTESDRPRICDCVNEGTVTADFKASSEFLYGGIAGRAELCDVERCANAASQRFSMTTDYFYMGGLAGVAKNSSLNGCSNTGAIVMDASSKVNTYFYGAGIAGYTHTDTALESCTNAGDITLENIEWNAARFLLGGIAGYGNENVTRISGCSNSGKVRVDGSVKGSAAFCGIGGVAGRTMAAVSSCSNSGSIVCSLRASSSETGVGGVIGTSYSLSVRECSNGGALTYNVVPDAVTGFCKAFYLGGVIGSLSPTAVGTYSYEGLENNAEILLNGSPAVLAIKTGGAAGRNNTSRDDLTDANRIAVGGVAGRMLLTNAGASISLKSCSNSGNMTAPEAGKIRYTAFGGVCGETIAADAQILECSNSGDISVQRAYNDGTNLHLGGIVGFIPNKKFTTCSINIVSGTNSGDISLSEINNTIQEARAGGILGDIVSTDSRCLTLLIDKCVNRGDISRVSSKRFASQSFGGGIAGSIGGGTWSFNAGMSDFNALVRDCENHGSIQFDACTSKGTILTDQTYNESATGGIVGNLRGTIYTDGRVRSAVVESCRNFGRVTGYSGFLGGICGIVSYYGTLRGNCVNEGEVGFRYDSAGNRDLSSTSYAGDLTTCGGIAGELFQGKLPAAGALGYTVVCENCVNRGDVGAVRYAGGIAGAFNEGGSTAEDITSCSSCGTIYGFYGKAGAVTGSERTTDPSLGRVRGCRAGGVVVRGSASTTLDASNYYSFIYQKDVSNDGLNEYWDGK